MAKPNYLDVVRAVKAELVAAGVNVDADETSRAEITFRAAERIHWRLDPQVGLLYKATGNHHRERAVDILCWPDGVIVDVLGAGNEGINTVLWMENAIPVDPSRWRAPFIYADQSGPTPSPPPAAPEPPPPHQPQPATPPVAVPRRDEPNVLEPRAPVPSGLQGVLQAAAAWAGQQLVTALFSWWSKRKAAPKPVGTVGSAIPRPTPVTRNFPPHP